jgi:hypothetical protein
MQRREMNRKIDNGGIRLDNISSRGKRPYMAVEIKRAMTYMRELQRMTEFSEYLRK